MQIPGIIGGIAPESTIDYYRRIITSYRKETGDGSYPPILINSIDLQRLLSLVGAGKLEELTDYFLIELDRLAKAGADFGLFASNTPHLVFEDLAERCPLPLVSIVETTCRRAQEQRHGKLGLLGTRFTMEADFYPRVFAKAGIGVVVPEEDERRYVHDKYMTELIAGQFLEDTRRGLLAIIDQMQERSGIDGVILGGTELPLILREANTTIPLLDTTELHVEQVVARMLS